MAKYLELDFKRAKFYEYSGTEKEGYEQVGNGYKKFHDEVVGELMSASIYEGKFGQQISLVIKESNGNFCYTPISLYNQKGQIDSFAESLITFLPNLEKGMNIAIRAYNFKPDNSKYAKIGVSIKVDGEKIERALSYEYKDKDGNVTEGDIPALVFEDDGLGKMKPSLTSIDAREKVLKKYLKESMEKLKRDDNSSSSTTSQSEDKPKNQSKQNTSQKPAPIGEDLQDDLPF